VPKVRVGDGWSGEVIDEGGFGRSIFRFGVRLQVI